LFRPDTYYYFESGDDIQKHLFNGRLAIVDDSLASLAKLAKGILIEHVAVSNAFAYPVIAPMFKLPFVPSAVTKLFNHI
jgi:hypothetical protein